MISLEQVRQLDIRVKKAVAAVKVLSNENAALKRHNAELESEKNNLEQQVTNQRADEQQLEVSLQGVLDILDEVNDETADIDPEPPEENYTIETIEDSESEADSEPDTDEEASEEMPLPSGNISETADEEILITGDTDSGEAAVEWVEVSPTAENEFDSLLPEENVSTLEDSDKTDSESESPDADVVETASVQESIDSEGRDENQETATQLSDVSEPETAVQMTLSDSTIVEIPPTGLVLGDETSRESSDLELSGTEIDPSDVEAGIDGPSTPADPKETITEKTPAATTQEKQEGIVVEVPASAMDAEPLVKKEDATEEVDLESGTDGIDDSSDDNQFQSEFDIF